MQLMQCTKLMRQTNKRKNQINNAVEVPRKCDNMHWLRIPLQMYSGVHAQTQLHMALDIALEKLHCKIAEQQLHCRNSTATTALHVVLPNAQDVALQICSRNTQKYIQQHMAERTSVHWTC